MSMSNSTKIQGSSKKQVVNKLQMSIKNSLKPISLKKILSK